MKKQTRTTQIPSLDMIDRRLAVLAAAGVLEVIRVDEESGPVYRLTPRYQKMSKEEAVRKMAEICGEVGLDDSEESRA